MLLQLTGANPNEGQRAARNCTAQKKGENWRGEAGNHIDAINSVGVRTCLSTDNGGEWHAVQGTHSHTGGQSRTHHCLTPSRISVDPSGPTSDPRSNT